MIRLFFLVIVFFFNSCSLDVEKNEWQYKSARAFHSFVQEYLSYDEILAKSDKKMAEHYAKQSADLRTLARVYLGECAVYISVGTRVTCKRYEAIHEVVNDDELQAYFALLNQKLTLKTLHNLPKKYKYFATAYYNQKYKKAFDALEKCDDDVSKLLWSALIKKYLSQKQRIYMLHVASFNGYKRAVIFWLREIKQYEKSQKQRKIIDKKIAILLK